MSQIGPPPAITVEDRCDARRILVVTAHPDDIDFGAAGSIASWVKAGAEVAYCIATDGDAGGSDRTVSRPDMAALRRDEQRAAAAEVGVTELTFLGFPDGRLTASIELRREISRAVRQFRPDRLVCQSPERNWDRIGASHPDHLAAGEAALCAAYPDARNPFAHPELLQAGLEPHAVREVWLMAAPRANRAVDITPLFEQKLRALRCHVSQVGHEVDLDGRLRGWAAGTAKWAGLPAGRLAESFQVVAMPASGSS
ncbi:MAG TPA: PIG-L deacetylase family protein [Acidimicrobiales bacterium]|nr:PIG-L deacetylase family protein [Acidimicrobiales bacterium]